MHWTLNCEQNTLSKFHGSMLHRYLPIIIRCADNGAVMSLVTCNIFNILLLNWKFKGKDFLILHASILMGFWVIRNIIIWCVDNGSVVFLVICFLYFCSIENKGMNVFWKLHEFILLRFWVIRNIIWCVDNDAVVYFCGM